MPWTRANLVINPSGEQSFNPSWTATNGVVSLFVGGSNDYRASDILLSSGPTNEQLTNTAATDFLYSSTSVVSEIDPYIGSKVIRYDVTAQNGLSYRVSPSGPQDATHRGAFLIDSTTRSVSVSIQVGSVNPIWVQPMARYLTPTGSGFTTLAVVNLGDPVYLGTPIWTELRRTAAVSVDASHWMFDVAVFTEDPRVNATPTPPVGTVLFLDAAYIPITGTFTGAGDSYFDGDSPGAFWGGTPHNSISYFGTPDVTPPEDPGTGVGNEPPPGSGEEDPTESPEEEPLPPNPEPPVITPPGNPTEADYNLPPEIVPPRRQAERIVTRSTVGGICLNEDVQIGGLVLNRLDEHGVLWVVSDIEGWWTLPEPDIPDYPRGLDDGSYETRGRYASRIFTLSGSFFPTSSAQVRQARAKLVQNINLCHQGAWFATHEEDATRASRVWLSGQPSIQTVNVAGRTDFSVGLKAPDPLKYGLKDRTLPGWHSVMLSSQTIDNPIFGRTYDRTYPWTYPANEAGEALANEASIINVGDSRVSPMMRLKGPTGGRLTIKNLSTDQTMRVVKRLSVNDELIINCQNKSVTLNGAVNQRFYLDLLSDWIYLAPGENRLFWFDEDSTSLGSLTVDWRPGWIG